MPAYHGLHWLARSRSRAAACGRAHLLEGHSGARAYALDKPIDGVRGERAAALGGKDVTAIGKLPAQLPQCLELVTAERVSLALDADLSRSVIADELRRAEILCPSHKVRFLMVDERMSIDPTLDEPLMPIDPVGR